MPFSQMSRALVLLAVVAVVLATPLRYDGSAVLKATPATELQLNALKNLRTEWSISKGLDWWVDPTFVGKMVMLRVNPSNREFVESQLRAVDLSWEVAISDVQALVEQQVARGPQTNDAFNFSEYHKLDEINAWVLSLPKQYPGFVEVVQVATSFENRPIYAVKITNGTSPTPKPGFWFDGGIHAREWITSATVVYMLKTLLTLFGRDNQITQLVNKMEIYVLPVFNVDGYEYTWTTDRMWRKTRSKNRGVCVGVDPNRNWDFHWADGGSSGNPCDDAYEGPKAFSEIEVRSVASYIKNHSNINGYINFHSFGQLWMSPWGYTAAKPKDFSIQNDLSAKATAAIAAVHGTKYEYGPIYTTIYPASGSSVDWTYGVVDTIFSYGVELRDTGTYGFLLPASEIVPSGEETFEALRTSLQYVLDHPRQ